MFTPEDLGKAKKRHDLFEIAEKKGIKLKRQLRNLRYEEELRLLQAQLVNLQKWIARKTNNAEIA